MDAARAALVADGTWLDIAALRASLPPRGALSEALWAYDRLLRAVDLSISAALAASSLVTMHDLEAGVVLKLREFKAAGVSRLADAGLGLLTRHPRVARCTTWEGPSGRLPPEIVRSGVFPRISGDEVMRALLDAMTGGTLRAWAGTEGGGGGVSGVLEALARDRGLPGAAHLCVAHRGDVHILKALSAARRASSAAASAFTKHAEERARRDAAQAATKHAAAAAEAEAVAVMEAAAARAAAAAAPLPIAVLGAAVDEPLSEEELLDYVKGALRAASAPAAVHRSLLEAVAAAEARVVEESARPGGGGGRGGFEALGHGTFASFLARHAQSLAALLPHPPRRPGGALSPTDCSAPPRAALLSLLRALPPRVTRLGAAAARPCVAAHFGGCDVSDSDLDAALAEAAADPRVHDDDDDNGEGEGGIPALAPLVAEPGDEADALSCGASAFAPHGSFDGAADAVPGPLGARTEADAVAALRSAPLLTDLHAATCWASLFAPSLGPLPPFLRRHIRRSRGAAVPGDPPPLSVLELSRGVFVRLPPRPSATEFARHLSRLQRGGGGGDDARGAASAGRAAAATAVALVSLSGHVASSPLALLSSHAATAVAASPSHAASAALAAAALGALPPPLHARLWAPVFWAPLAAIIPDAASALLAACGRRRSPARLALARLSLSLGVPLWLSSLQSDFVAGSASSDDDGNSIEGPPGDPLRSPGAFVAVSEQPLPPPSAARTADAVSAETIPAASLPGSGGDTDECEALCASIAARFGLPIPKSADAATAAAVRALQAGWARAIQRLAAELYAKDTHYVLELVQNADDNAYDADVLPTLSICLDQDGVSFLNNEVGFTAANVAALCSVGESTKSGGSIGYIGNKGIGFKSVFKVTPTPEVHSRGFHIGFDARPGCEAEGRCALGYIVPSPLPPPAGWDAQHSGTLIRLPFVPRGTVPAAASPPPDAAALAASLRRSLADIRPSLLLFLHRLRRLRVVDRSRPGRAVARTFTRVDECGGAVVAISQEEAEEEEEEERGETRGEAAGPRPVASRTERWAVFSILLDAKVPRAGVARTELAMAFPLVARASLDACASLPSQEARVGIDPSYWCRPQAQSLTLVLPILPGVRVPAAALLRLQIRAPGRLDCPLLAGSD